MNTSTNTRRLRKLSAVIGAALTALAAATVGTSTAMADIPCTDRTMTQAFSSWGDWNDYFLAPSGRFEDGLGEWIPSGGVTMRYENSPFYINGWDDVTSVRLAAGASITLPRLCVRANEDRMRMFARSAYSGIAAPIEVTASITNGGSTATKTGNVTLTPGVWAPTSAFFFPDVRDQYGQEYVTITITNRSTTTPLLIDDVMVDPWRTH